MNHQKFRLLMRPGDPLLVTREIDVFFAIAWAIFASWGYLAVFHGLETITLAAGPLFNFLWALSIALLSTIATLASVFLFFRTSASQVTKKRIELAAAWGLVFLIAVYPVYLGIRTVVTDNNNLWASTVLSLLYLLIPVFRIRNLRYRIKYYAKSYSE